RGAVRRRALAGGSPRQYPRNVTRKGFPVRSKGVRYTQVQTPRGVRDYLGAEAAAKRAAEEAFRETFAAWGYEEVITPTVEFFEALALSDGVDLAERMF